MPFDTWVGRAALWLGRLAVRPNNGLPNMLLRALAGLLSGSGPPEVDDNEAMEDDAAVAVLALLLAEGARVEGALVDGAPEVNAEAAAVAEAALSPSKDDSREDRSRDDRSFESRPFRRASAAAPLAALLGDFAEVGLVEGARRVAGGGSTEGHPSGVVSTGRHDGLFLAGTRHRGQDRARLGAGAARRGSSRALLVAV